ncbi:uncharacterized protein K444DRAFT_578502, partial [Hyaloscypha bicolor E]
TTQRRTQRTPGPKRSRETSSRLQYSSHGPTPTRPASGQAPSLLELQPDRGPPTPLQLQLQRSKQHRDESPLPSALCHLPSASLQHLRGLATLIHLPIHPELHSSASAHSARLEHPRKALHPCSGATRRRDLHHRAGDYRYGHFSSRTTGSIR